jgi:hypothetical protein
MLNYIITEDTITVLIDNTPKVIDTTHKNYHKVIEALKTGANEDTVRTLIDVSEAIKEFGEGLVSVKDGEITYNGKVVHSALATRILSLMGEGFDVTPFVKFMDNLYKNPSKRAVDELYGFLEACNLPITEDGYFLAYKKVREDYTDVYTGTFDNSIGAKPSMPRYEVDENSERTCSQGLHVASYSYMEHYSGDRIVICKVNPSNVVAVPKDYNNSKMRVCEYEVINEVRLTGEELPKNVIADEEAYSEDYFVEYESTESTESTESVTEEYIIDMLRDNSLEEIIDLTKENGYTNAYNYLTSIKKNTPFWKDRVGEILKEEVINEIVSEDDKNKVIKSRKDLKKFLKNSSYKEVKKYAENNSLERTLDFLNKVSKYTAFWEKQVYDIMRKELGIKEKFSVRLEKYLNYFTDNYLDVLDYLYDILDDEEYDMIEEYLEISRDDEAIKLIKKVRKNFDEDEKEGLDELIGR